MSVVCLRDFLNTVRADNQHANAKDINTAIGYYHWDSVASGGVCSRDGRP